MDISGISSSFMQATGPLPSKSDTPEAFQAYFIRELYLKPMLSASLDDAEDENDEEAPISSHTQDLEWMNTMLQNHLSVMLAKQHVMPIPGNDQ